MLVRLTKYRTVLPRQDSCMNVTLDSTDMLFIPTGHGCPAVSELAVSHCTRTMLLSLASQEANARTHYQQFTLEFRIFGASLLTDSRDIVNVRGMPTWVNIKPVNN